MSGDRRRWVVAVRVLLWVLSPVIYAARAVTWIFGSEW